VPALALAGDAAPRTANEAGAATAAAAPARKARRLAAALASDRAVMAYSWRRLRLIQGSEDDVLTASHQISREPASDLPRADDRCSHGLPRAAVAEP
jgi:hypothetical protein